MAANGVGARIDQVAQDLYTILAQLGLGCAGRRRKGDLKDAEFIALSLLQRRSGLTVGEIQRRLGVLPAQMSRILRGLESRDRPLVACRINPHDKRKINVVLTAAGARALKGHQAVRANRLTALLSYLPGEDLDDLSRLVSKVQERLSPPMSTDHPGDGAP
jgi:DNA-binding MarR family transcriptional regulator